MKQKTGRKLLSFLLTLAMLVGLMPGMGLTAYAADEVSENISLVASDSSNLKTISGTHYSVSCGYMNAAESGMQVCKAGALTINARKGETITKVVLTYSWGNNKSSLSASAGTFDGNATISDINAQQVTISSSNTAGVKISAVRVYFEGDLNNPTVTLTGGANAKSSGGLLTQSYLPGAMDTVTYTALTGAAFPAFENFTQNGVTVERTSDTVVTISGTPTANTEITVPDAESSSKIVTWDSSIINASGRNGIGYQIRMNNSYSDTANGITLTKSGSGYASLNYGDWMTSGDVTLNFTTATGKFTSIEIEASQIYDGGNWTKDGNTLKWNGTPSNSVSLSGSGLYLEGVSSINFVIEMPTVSVTITPGSNMTKTTDSGAASQTDLSGAMTDVVYTADDGYYFPTDYSVATVNGISVTRNSYTQITVSGTPTADASITLTAPTAKTTPDAPTTVTVVNCTTADNNDGKLTGVTAAMEYKKSDAADWTAGTGSDITDLFPGTYYVRVKATETTNASTNQELTIANYNTAAANTVSGTISALPAAADVTLDNAQAVADAKAAYDALTDDQKALVPADTVNKLNAAVAKIADLTAANTVSGTISALPAAADITLDNAQAVADAKAAYDALTDDQKALVPADTVNKLNAAVAKIADLTAANTVSNTISALPDFSNVTTANKDAIEATRTAYNALTDDQKAYVSADTLKKLTDAEDKLVIIQVMSEVSAKTGSGMTYTGNPIQLINTPTTALPAGYTMQYAVTTENTAPTDASLYTTSIPTATAAGTYYVWYKVVGDENHNDTEAVCVTASIQRRSSGGGSSTTTVTVPVTSDTATGSVPVTASVSGTTATVTKLTDEQITQVTTNKSGNKDADAETETNSVVIDVSGVAKDVKTATIPTETVKAVEETGSNLKVTLTDGSVEFDATAQAIITDEAKGTTIQVNLDAVKVTTLTSAQQSAVESLEVEVVLDAYVTSNGQRISDFKGGSATLSVPYTLKDGQAAQGIVVWYVASDGTRTQVDASYDGKNVVFTVPHFSNYVIAYDAAKAAACPQDTTCPISAFTDARTTAWYHDGVHWAIENSVMNGVGDGKFAPNGITTRAQVVTMLWRLEGSPAYVGMSEFSDVDNEQWYGPAIRWASAEGIVNGYDDGRFGANDAVTREQLVTILYRYAQYKKMDVSVGEDTNILSYDDAFDVSEWAIPAMQWACGSGIVNGIDKNGTLMLAPSDASTRAVVATMFWRFSK